MSDCAVCADGGWVFVESGHPALPERHRHAGAAVACLCATGQRVAQAPIGVRKILPKTLDWFWSTDEIERAFPDGTARAAEIAQIGRLAAMGIPGRMQQWTLDSYRDIVAKDDTTLGRYVHYARAWIASEPDTRSDVLLYGSNGTGKTGLAVACLRSVIDAGQVGMLVVARDLLNTLRAGQTADDTAGDAAAPYHAPDVLVIDELGSTNLTPFAIDAVTALLDVRQNARKATVITCNVNGHALMPEDVQDQLTAMLGARLADRLREHATAWAFMGASRRKTRKRSDVGNAAHIDTTPQL